MSSTGVTIATGYTDTRASCAALIARVSVLWSCSDWPPVGSCQALHIVVSMNGHGTDRFLAQPAHRGSHPKPHTNSELSMTALGALSVAAVCLLFGVAFALTRIFNR
jgi:hypothetical protein